MILLDATTRKLQIVLAGAKTTNDSPFVASYVDIAQTGFAMQNANSNTGTSNGITAVDVVAAPSAGNTRQLKYFSLLNADTVAITATVRYNDNTTIRNMVTFILTVGSSLIYTPDQGWAIVPSALQAIANASDYSTGSWTPADNSGAGLSFSAVIAKYTRIGNMVFAYGTLLYPATVSGATNNISGLPFAAPSLSNFFWPASAFGVANVGAALVINGTSTFEFVDQATNAAPVNSVLSASRMGFSLNYSLT